MLSRVGRGGDKISWSVPWSDIWHEPGREGNVLVLYEVVWTGMVQYMYWYSICVP